MHNKHSDPPVIFFQAQNGICSMHVLILKRFLKEPLVELFYRHYWGITPERKILKHCWKSPGSSANPQAFVIKRYLPCLLTFSWLLRSLQFFRQTWQFTYYCLAGHKPNLSIHLNSLSCHTLHSSHGSKKHLREVHNIELTFEKKLGFWPSKWKLSLTHPLKAMRNQPHLAWKFGALRHWSPNPVIALNNLQAPKWSVNSIPISKIAIFKLSYVLVTFTGKKTLEIELISETGLEVHPRDWIQSPCL